MLIKNNKNSPPFCWRSKSKTRRCGSRLRQQSENQYFRSKNRPENDFHENFHVFLNFLNFLNFGWFWAALAIRFDCPAWFPARGRFQIDREWNFRLVQIFVFICVHFDMPVLVLFRFIKLLLAHETYMSSSAPLIRAGENYSRPLHIVQISSIFKITCHFPQNVRSSEN